MESAFKTFLIHVHLQNGEVLNFVVPDFNLDEMLTALKSRHEGFKRIVVYDAETSDAIKIIKA